MRKLTFAVLFGLAACAAVAEPSIANVQIRQQWPWSTNVTIDYDVRGLDAAAPQDVVVTAYSGDTELGTLPAAALSGARHRLTTDGRRRLVFDPTKSAFADRGNLADFNVALALAPSTAGSEILYKIVDLGSGAVTDVSRADLQSGAFGAVETSFAFVGTTTLSDVLIWTGVKDDPAYRTTHMVFRKIPAGTFTMGSPTTEAGRTADRETQHEVTFTRDFWLSVFRATQAQWLRISPETLPTNVANADSFRDPAKGTTALAGITYYDLRGDYAANAAAGGDWPGDGVRVAPTSFFGRLRARLNVRDFDFDLPTEAQWEYACRAGTDTPLYDGTSATSGLERLRLPAGGVAGSRPPNAYGVYDMLAVDGEYVLDYSAKTYGGAAGAAATDPKGGTRAESMASWPRILRGVNRAANRSFIVAGAYQNRTYGFHVALQPAGWAERTSE